MTLASWSLTKAALCDAAIEGLGSAAPTTTFLALDKHGHSLVSLWQGIPCTIRNLTPQARFVLAEKVRATGCIRAENSRFVRKVIFSLNIRNSLQALASHAAANRIDANHCHIRVMDWMQRNHRHIIYDAGFVSPSQTSALCYNVQRFCTLLQMI